jgi:hypothetical protein
MKYTTSRHLAHYHGFKEVEGFLPCVFCLLGGHRFLSFELLTFLDLWDSTTTSLP